MSVQLIIGETDFSKYLVSSERKHSLCAPIASLTLQLAWELPRIIDPYEPMVFYENATKVFTGHTEDFFRGRMPPEVRLLCYDVLRKALDFWLENRYTANGETVEAWVRYFLSLAGLTDVNSSVLSAYKVFPGYTWEKVTVLDAITTILRTTPYQIFADAEGVIQLAETNRGALIPNHTLSGYLDYERIYNDSWIRNRIVVFGYGFASEQQETNPYLLPGEVRTAAAGTGQIYSEGTAYELAGKMLEEFRNPLDEKVIIIEGNPEISLGQAVDFTDISTGYSREDCIVTEVVSTYDSTGYKTEVSLDKKCVNFWGWDTIPPPFKHQAVIVLTTNNGKIAISKDFFTPGNNNNTWTDISSGLENAGSIYSFDIAPTGEAYLVSYNSNNLAACGLFYCPDILDASWLLTLSIEEAREESGSNLVIFKSVAVTDDGVGWVVSTLVGYPWQRPGYWTAISGIATYGGQIPISVEASYSQCFMSKDIYTVYFGGMGNYESAASVVKLPDKTFIKASQGSCGLRELVNVSENYMVWGTGFVGKHTSPALAVCGVGSVLVAPAGTAHICRKILEAGRGTHYDPIIYCTSYDARMVLQAPDTGAWTTFVPFAIAADVFGPTMIGGQYDCAENDPTRFVWVCADTGATIRSIAYTDDRGIHWYSKDGDWSEKVGIYAGGAGRYPALVRVYEYESSERI